MAACRQQRQRGQSSLARAPGSGPATFPKTGSGDTLAAMTGEGPLGQSPDATSTSGTSQAMQDAPPAAAAAGASGRLPRPRSAEQLGRPPLAQQAQPAGPAAAAAEGEPAAGAQAPLKPGPLRPAAADEHRPLAQSAIAAAEPASQAAEPAQSGQQPADQHASSPSAAVAQSIAAAPEPTSTASKQQQLGQQLQRASDHSAADEAASGKSAEQPQQGAKQEQNGHWAQPLIRLPTWTSPQRAFSTTDAVLQWLNTDRRRGSGQNLDSRASFVTGK